MISTIIAYIDLTETTLTYRFFLAFPPDLPTAYSIVGRLIDRLDFEFFGVTRGAHGTS